MAAINFEQLLMLAKQKDSNSLSKLFDMYRPLLIKEALVEEMFDEDLYQELQGVLLRVIKAFAV